MPKRSKAAWRRRTHMKTTNEPGANKEKGSRFAREPSPAKSEARKAHDRTTVSALRHHQLMEEEDAVVLFAMRAISHSFLKIMLRFTTKLLHAITLPQQSIKASHI